MKSKEVSPVWFVAAIAATLLLAVGAGMYFMSPRENNPVPPGGYKQINKEDFSRIRAQQMRDYANSTGGKPDRPGLIPKSEAFAKTYDELPASPSPALQERTFRGMIESLSDSKESANALAGSAESGATETHAFAPVTGRAILVACAGQAEFVQVWTKVHLSLVVPPWIKEPYLKRVRGDSGGGFLALPTGLA